MFTGIVGVVLAAGVSMSAAQADMMPIDLGEYRITTYGIYCNEPVGRQSASGKTLEYGDVAMNGVPFGSKISIDGEIFTVTDRCGIDGTVDIFIETNSDHCTCNTLDYKEVYLLRGE